MHSAQFWLVLSVLLAVLTIGTLGGRSAARHRSEPVEPSTSAVIVTAEVISAKLWRDGEQQTITFKAIEPFLEAGVSQASLARKTYRRGPANTFFVVAGNEIVEPGLVNLRVQLGTYANMEYLGRAEVEPFLHAVPPSDDLLEDIVYVDHESVSAEYETIEDAEKVEDNSDLVRRIQRIEDEVKDLNARMLDVVERMTDRSKKATAG